MNRRSFIELTVKALAGSIIWVGFSGCSQFGDAEATDKPSLEPRITPINKFFVPNPAGTVNLASEQWTLNIAGLVQQPLEITYSDLLSLPKVEAMITLECINNRSQGNEIGNAVWVGASLRPLLDKVGVLPEAEKAVIFGADRHTIELSTTTIMDRDVLLTYQMNNFPLTPEHGFPARMLVPGRFGYKSAKWVVKIDFQLGQESSPETSTLSPFSEILSVPVGEIQAGKKYWIGGYAFSGEGGLSRVEVSTDGGKSWHEAFLGSTPSDDVWALWAYQWHPVGRGERLLLARAVDVNGRIESAAELGSGIGRKPVHQISLNVTDE